MPSTLSHYTGVNIEYFVSRLKWRWLSSHIFNMCSFGMRSRDHRNNSSGVGWLPMCTPFSCSPKTFKSDYMNFVQICGNFVLCPLPLLVLSEPANICLKGGIYTHLLTHTRFFLVDWE